MQDNKFVPEAAELAEETLEQVAGGVAIGDTVQLPDATPGIPITADTIGTYGNPGLNFNAGSNSKIT